MLNELVQLSKKHAVEHRKDPVLAARMELGFHGQAPRYLIISPINRSRQDIQIFNINTGDAFHATRVPGHVLLPSNLSPTLVKGPASFNHAFSNQKGIILTFENDESLDIIRETIENISLNPDLKSLPIIAFQVDYLKGRARLIVHNKGRNYEYENKLLHHLGIPEELDNDLLVLLCSDSRVEPPLTNKGFPLAIRTLGGYIPAFTGKQDETEQLHDFFQTWLVSGENPKHILIVAHGNFEGDGSSCGAGTASLKPSAIQNASLRQVIEEIDRVAEEYERTPPNSPEDRVKSISKAIRANLLTYPPISDASSVYKLSIDDILMDTITNTLSQSDEF